MSPFFSKSQARFMYAKHPGMAREFAAHTASIKSLPDKVSQALDGAYKRKKRKKRSSK